jgi:hypothetical protein
VAIYPRDTATTNTPFAFLLPYETFTINDGSPVQAANLNNTSLFPVKLINGVITVSWIASGSGTLNASYRLQGYDLAIP